MSGKVRTLGQGVGGGGGRTGGGRGRAGGAERAGAQRRRAERSKLAPCSVAGGGSWTLAGRGRGEGGRAWRGCSGRCARSGGPHQGPTLGAQRRCPATRV